MALVATKLTEQRVGNKIMQIWKVEHTSVTTGTFKTGLSNIQGIYFNNETTEIDGRVMKNKSAASTADLGSVFTDGFTSNDEATITVIGN